MNPANAKLMLWLGSAALLAGIATLLLWWAPAFAADAAEPAAAMPADAVKWGFITAALATGISSIGAAFAVATVGSAAIGALTEKPELFGRVLIVVGLAEGIAIYGLIVSILILNKIT